MPLFSRRGAVPDGKGECIGEHGASCFCGRRKEGHWVYPVHSPRKAGSGFASLIYTKIPVLSVIFHLSLKNKNSTAPFSKPKYLFGKDFSDKVPKMQSETKLIKWIRLKENIFAFTKPVMKTWPLSLIQRNLFYDMVFRWVEDLFSYHLEEHFNSDVHNHFHSWMSNFQQSTYPSKFALGKCVSFHFWTYMTVLRSIVCHQESNPVNYLWGKQCTHCTLAPVALVPELQFFWAAFMIPVIFCWCLGDNSLLMLRGPYTVLEFELIAIAYKTSNLGPGR